MRSLRDALQQSQKDGVAIGHFNVGDWVLLKAVFASGQELKVPVVVGASEGEREFIGVRQIAAVVRSLREEFDCPIFLNADHTHSLAKAVEATKAGFDAIVFDLSALPFEQNVRQTKEAVETLKTINPAILVEGEIGDIGTGSEIHEEAPDLSKVLTSPAEAKQFVEATGVDILAPAVGNMHGMLKSMGAGKDTEAVGCSENSRDQEGGPSAAYPAWRIGYRRRGSTQGNRRRDQYHPHQHRTAGCTATWPGAGLEQTAQRSRSLQDPAPRSGIGEGGCALTLEII
jgi:ketose-bisphosphate aldolase